MNIVVCIKQVPDTVEVKIDPKTGTLIRDGVPSIINHDDKTGIEAALQMKEQLGGKVTVVSMGPPQADVALREALAMGCDEAVLVSAREFGGSDTYATSGIIAAALKKLGYDLSEEDGSHVWEAFRRIASRKEQISSKELDTIVASTAMQVPATYRLDSYVITSSNVISSVAHIKVKKDEEVLEGLTPGDGSIDAAFLALEQIVGCHYELDDFQIQAVTEGREAMGETLVKLRSNGKLYSGRGISTDIVGAGIQAYINALNKIVYEEAEA